MCKKIRINREYRTWVRNFAKNCWNSGTPVSKVILAESLASHFNLSPEYAREIVDIIYK